MRPCHLNVYRRATLQDEICGNQFEIHFVDIQHHAVAGSQFVFHLGVWRLSGCSEFRDSQTIGTRIATAGGGTASPPYRWWMHPDQIPLSMRVPWSCREDSAVSCTTHSRRTRASAPTPSVSSEQLPAITLRMLLTSAFLGDFFGRMSHTESGRGCFACQLQHVQTPRARNSTARKRCPRAASLVAIRMVSGPFRLSAYRCLPWKHSHSDRSIWNTGVQVLLRR